MQTITLGEIYYNDAIGAYEARVDVQRDQGTYRYPCLFKGPRGLERDQVQMGLVRQALECPILFGTNPRRKF
ncbi:hypothetical protein B9057_12330 [Aestuarium zhoushanense]|nr:hypothetical protein B9057_12330 [Aestuarium zhoushanense]